MAPSISLPRGGGAIRDIGEKFAANPVTGTGSMSVPLTTSPGRSGFGPQLSLSYDSGAGNGPFGFGWHLSIPAITRKTDKGMPLYRDAVESDVFILAGAEDLVPVVQGGARFEDTSSAPGYTIYRYRPRIEGLFARIERWTRTADGDIHWRSLSRDNVLTLYGTSGDTRIADPADATRIFSWLVSETRDDKGNVILYEYEPEDGAGVDLTAAHQRNRGDASDPRRTANRYIKRIRYGNTTPLLDGAGQRPAFLLPAQAQGAGWLFEVVFDYGEHHADAPRPDDPGPWIHRDDAFSSYRAGFEVRTARLCRRVLMFHHFPDEPGVGGDCLVRSTDLTYSHQQDPQDRRNPIYTFLRAFAHTGYRRTDGGYEKRSLPPVEFEYTQPVLQDVVKEVEPASLENLPIGLDGAAYQWTDLHGEGIPGILTEQAGAWFYKRNLSPIGARPVEFAPLERVAVRPAMALAAGAQIMDLAGDGRPDLVLLDGPTPGFYEHDAGEGWQSFRAFKSHPHRSPHDPNVKLVDLDGDGHADLLITEDDALIWHASLGEAGFGPARRVAQALDEEKGPRVVFADGTQSIYLADLSGDGLSDLVRIRNGEICYWPNLGYGRFGAKVTMDGAPHFDHPDLFDHRRIRLADIDGSGTTDLIYLHRDGVRIYFNQCGNGWSEPQALPAFPRADDLPSIVPADLLGNGTACLVWSSSLARDARRPMRYVDLMGGQKPHLLVRMVNNLGAETRIHYAASTKFYLQDRRDGRPWITRLPFPVHVVERVETYDHISRNRHVTRYAYHHGHFDGEEREFRGFGMVEQWDTEEIAALTADGTLPATTNEDAASHVPPVLTRTWFHTGVYLDRDRVSNQMAGEYFREPGLTDAAARELLLPDTLLPAGLTVDEEREACRALKGLMLRQEVYARDGSEKESFPYSVTEQNFSIRPLQPMAPNRHAVFFTHAREALSFHYERNPADPRVQHALTLEVDDYGNVLNQAAIGYGRRGGGSSALGPSDRDKQAALLATASENRFTNPVDAAGDYRAPLPAEARTFELTGMALPQGHSRFSLAEVLAAASLATPIPYEQSPTPGALEKRLIEHARTLYRRDDLTGALPLGGLESRALPFESHRLAFTPGLVATVYAGRVPDALLEDEGRYVHSDGDLDWWIPSGRVHFSPGSADTPAQELAWAVAHFFLPRRTRDPFHTEQLGTERFIDYDPYDLLPIETRDPLGNRVTAGERLQDGSTVPGNDYRVLQPRVVMDPNRNRTRVAYDILGMVVGTAAMGKPEESLGDSLEGFVTDLTDAEIADHLGDPLADPHAILGRATTRLVYDVFAYQRTRDLPDPQPAVVYTLARETHDSDLLPGKQTRVQHGFTYSDGFGREIQKKHQAAPGGSPAPPRWLGSGWTIFNNKGNPVRKYEPFYSAVHTFEFGMQVGVSPILFYDPVGRVVATLHPNHTYEKVLFDPWRQETWDVNDTLLLDPETDDVAGPLFARLPGADYLPTWHDRMSASAAAADNAAALRTEPHAGTPAIAHFDALGRAFLTIADNGTDGRYETRVELDIEGNQRAVIDALGRAVMRYDHSLGAPEKDKEAANRIHQTSMDAGQRWFLRDVAGHPIRSWDERGHELQHSYDVLRRPVQTKVLGGDGDVPLDHVFDRMEYGESQPDPEPANLRGQPFRHYDTGGLLETPDYDFRGRSISIKRRLFRKYKEVANWIDGNLAADLEAADFTFVTAMDALGRISRQTAPDGSVITPGYDEGGLLRTETVAHADPAVTTNYVEDIEYDEKGQRARIEYGNGVVTRYEYESDTFRLHRIDSRRPSGEALQDLLYTYDPVGNITSIEDRAIPISFFANAAIEPRSEYTYDALYRLTAASGRENTGALTFGREDNWNDAPFTASVNAGDPMAVRHFTQGYRYDAVGNILRMQHHTSNNNWTRHYHYGASSNRLVSTQVGARTYSYPHHPQHGYMTSMPHLAALGWNFKEEIAHAIRHRRNDGGTPETTYYQYGGHGQRLRKITENTAAPGATPTPKDERIYIAGYELYLQHSGADAGLERRTLSLLENEHRFVMVETRNEVDDGTEQFLVRYQLHNHLGSAALELDGAAEVISYEEYHPYGTTAYQAKNAAVRCAAKRYRYTGMERDEETGLGYHGARYYLPCAGRWTCADPIGTGDGLNVYSYVGNRPLGHVDSSGKQGHPPRTHRIQKGDSFWKLENKYHYKHGTLQKLNQGIDPNRLQVGSSINLPSDIAKSAGPKSAHSAHHTSAHPTPTVNTNDYLKIAKNFFRASPFKVVVTRELNTIEASEIKVTEDIQRPEQGQLTFNLKMSKEDKLKAIDLTLNRGQLRVSMEGNEKGFTSASMNYRIGNFRYGMKQSASTKDLSFTMSYRNNDTGLGGSLEMRLPGQGPPPEDSSALEPANAERARELLRPLSIGLTIVGGVIAAIEAIAWVAPAL